MNFEQARFNMIEQQIRPWNVLDPQVLELLNTVKREDFVLPAYRALAFADLALPLRANDSAGPCMLPPRVQARLLQDVAPRKHESVLQIGAGSGYLTALLAHCAKRVIALEIEPDLATVARTNLRQAGIHNADVRQADGASYSAPEAPFDVILLCGAVVQLPEQLMSQLKPGGRLMAIVGQEPIMHATLVTRGAGGSLEQKQPWDTVAPMLRHFASAPAFSF